MTGAQTEKPTRRALPTRRHCVTASTIWRGQKIEVSVGFDPETGEVCEAFADIAKGGDMQHVLSDGCVMASIALQCGVTVEALQKTMGSERLSVDGRAFTEPTSPVGAALETVRMVADGVLRPGFFGEGEG
jgi:predicted aconitase with swiveling domain